MTLQKATFGKRLLAILYDVLIVFFFTFLITLIVQQLIIQLNLIPLEAVPINKEGQTVKMIPADSFITPLLKNLWFVISLFYFGRYWTKTGQTLGMKVWKIKVVTTSGEAINWQQALYRLLFSLLGLGLIWMIFNKNRLALQDVVSQTQLIKVA